MNMRLLFLIGIIFFGAENILHGMVYDNRFIFLTQRPRVSVAGRPSFISADFFVETARKAVASNENEIPIGHLFGEFDQGKMARAFPLIGKENAFDFFGRPDWQDGTFLWHVEGNIQTQGVAFAFHEQLTDWLSGGATWLAMRAHAWFSFSLKESSIPMTAAETRELDRIRRQMFQLVGLVGNKSTQSGVGDLDFYLRVGYAWDYLWKLRHVDVGCRFGALIPTGVKKESGVPLSIPFGGNGHYGLYATLDAETEIKEDWKLGGLIRVSKRFSRTVNHRVPVNNETPFFGLLVIPLTVTPGVTVALSPYFSMENLREGFGMRLQYTLLHHGADHFCDARLLSCRQEMPASLDDLHRFSHWSSDYITVAAFYDFGKMKMERCFSPVVTLSWDIPSLLVVAHRMVKSHRIIFGIEFSF